jgi:hypothetical protein
MIENIFIKIFILLLIGVIIYVIYNLFYQKNLTETPQCKINDYDIDDLVVIKRTPEYSKLIDNLIDEKSFIFTDEQLKVLKNPQQIFDVSNNKDNKQNISNISYTVYSNCKNELKKNTFDFDDNINNTNTNNNESFDNLVDLSDKEYDKIKNMLKNDIKKLLDLSEPHKNFCKTKNFIRGPNCFNTGVIKQNIPLIKNYLKNYYQDLYGNKIYAELKDYFTAYYTLINEDDNVGLPVNTLIGTSDFIIPDQYNYDSHFTNAYNIDWDRIINPISYSQ